MNTARKRRLGKQPRQGIVVRETILQQEPIPRCLTNNSASMTIPISITTAAATLATTQVGYSQLSLIARWANISSYFVNVNFIDVTFLPTSLSAAGYCEVSFLRKHLPYNPTSSDSSSAAPYSVASLALLPGYQKWNQGNGDLGPRTYKLGYKMRQATFNTDQPVLFEFMSYASAATTLLVLLRVSFTDIVTGI